VFDPIRSYDKPGVILTQIVNGIATTDSVRRVLFDPASSSPRERESFVDGLKKEYGGNAVSDTVIDVFTNPVVWLALMAGGGVGAKNLASGGRFFAGGRPGHWMAPYAKAGYPFLRAIGMTSGATEGMGKRIAQYGGVALAEQDRTRQLLQRHMEPGVAKVYARLEKLFPGQKFKTLRPEDAPSPEAKYALESIMYVAEIEKTGLLQATQEYRLTGLEPNKNYITVTTPATSPGGKPKKNYLEVDNETFETLRQREKNQTTLGESHQSVDRATDGALLKKLPGLKPGENLFASMTDGNHERLGLRVGITDGEIPELSLAADAFAVSGVRAKWHATTKQQQVTDRAAVEADIREYDMQDMLNGQRNMYEHAKVLKFGNEKAYAEGRGFVADENKILRHARSQVESYREAGLISEDGKMKEGGAAAVLDLLNDETFNRIRNDGSLGVGDIRPGMTGNELIKVVVDAYKKSIDDPYYMPRNTGERYDRMDRRIASNNSVAEGWTNEGDYLDSSGRNQFRTKTIDQTMVSPDDLQGMYDRYGGTLALASRIKSTRRWIQQEKERNGSYRVLRVSPDVAAAKYIETTARDYAFHSHDVMNNASVRITNIDYSPGETSVQLPGPVGRSKLGAPANVRQLETIDKNQLPAGGYSLHDLIQTELKSIEKANPGDAFIVNQWRKNILPAITGTKPLAHAGTSAASDWIKEQTLRFANSDFMKAVAGQNKTAKRFVNNLRRWSTDRTGDEFNMQGGLTKALYVSHLGLNMGTITNNLMQPLQSVHQLGLKNTVKAYGQSLEMIGKYMTERSKLPKNATSADIEALQRKMYTRTFGKESMDLMDIADLGSAFGMLEKAGFGVRGIPTGKPQFSYLEMMMKPFQMSETLNRLTTANAVFNAYETAGMVGLKQRRDIPRARADATLAVQQMQFGSNPITRPSMFYLPVLNQPLMRQFAQYSVRTLANFAIMPGMLGGTRKTAFGEISGKYPVMMNDLLRSVAVATVAYEVGKNVLGVDLSRGLGLGATDLLTQSYVPPVVDISVDTLKMIGTGDAALMQDIIPRILPGGISLSRALSTTDKSETLQALGLQKTYADWSKSQNGMVPMYQSDGRLMGEYPTSDVVLRALGTDMGRFSNSAEVNQFLLKNRDAMRDGRRRYIASVLGNNMSTAASIKGEFERRFGMPLTVTQDQMKAAIKLREEPITGRTLETITPNARDVYRQAIEQTLPGVLKGVPYTPPTEQGAMYQWAMRGKQSKEDDQG